MTKRKLIPDLQNWLYLNYPNMTNAELAEELTEKMRGVILKERNRLSCLLAANQSVAVERMLKKRIETLDKFSGVSESLIKRYAREMHCPRKSRMHLVKCNQEKARITNFKRWLKKAEKVENVADWLRTFKEKDSRFCFISGEGQLKSILVSINKFNRYEGYDQGAYLTSQHIPEIGLLRVNANLYRT